MVIRTRVEREEGKLLIQGLEDALALVQGTLEQTNPQ